MLKRIVLLSSLLVTSMTAHAGLIQYGDYKRDSASNIVTGGGLEWLKWDVTKGMSINAALASYASQGWRLASNDEMASMYNLFSFGKTNWNAYEYGHQFVQLPWNSGDEFNSYAAFIRLFGYTVQPTICSPGGASTDCYRADDPSQTSLALYGSDLNKNKRYKLAWVSEDSTYVHSLVGLHSENYMASIQDDTFDADNGYSPYGVALVRNRVPDNVAVPTPGSIGLLTLGLVALGYRRRNVLGR